MTGAAGTLAGPLVTVGMPVRNGGGMFPRALASVLGQTHANLEILISDNGSTDGTAEVARAAAEADPRVRCIPPAEPLRAFDNLMHVLAEARGEYFMWAAHDDLRSPDSIAGLLPAFADPAVVLAFGDLHIARSFGEEGLKQDYDFASGSRGPLARVRRQALMQCFHIYGLWRTEPLRRLPKRHVGWWPDLPIMMGMALRGTFVHRPGPRFTYLEVPKTDAERMAYQDFAADMGKLRNVLALCGCTYAVFREIASRPVAALATGFVIEKAARMAVASARRRLGLGPVPGAA